jgi:hydroxypyruvate isomerase
VWRKYPQSRWDLHGDVLTSLAALLPIIGQIQIAAVPDRHEPGTSELDDIAILQHLDRLRYGGCWSGMPS